MRLGVVVVVVVRREVDHAPRMVWVRLHEGCVARLGGSQRPAREMHVAAVEARVRVAATGSGEGDVGKGINWEKMGYLGSIANTAV